MKRLKGGKISCYRSPNSVLKNRKIGGVGEEIPVVKHIDPNLSIVDDFGNESFFNHLAGSGGMIETPLSSK